MAYSVHDLIPGRNSTVTAIRHRSIRVSISSITTWYACVVWIAALIERDIGLWENLPEADGHQKSVILSEDGFRDVGDGIPDVVVWDHMI